MESVCDSDGELGSGGTRGARFDEAWLDGILDRLEFELEARLEDERLLGDGTVGEVGDCP